jgi:hypothetical protein
MGAEQTLENCRMLLGIYAHDLLQCDASGHR